MTQEDMTTIRLLTEWWMGFAVGEAKSTEGIATRPLLLAFCTRRRSKVGIGCMVCRVNWCVSLPGLASDVVM
ncbi:hypothetical protein BDV23DRAFT_159851 [Aspergillus alliaceus]|uniref:Uncharacterized protein n=1 Tax=Petromyces alliaceus TaxID=209559 RepID=A0A5N7C1N4_PETAA|nr:hypothetical protein BDV23DRAFT_159851 [Aspergillus alliaceus]